MTAVTFRTRRRPALPAVVAAAAVVLWAAVHAAVPAMFGENAQIHVVDVGTVTLTTSTTSTTVP